MCTETIVVEEKEENTFSLKQMTNVEKYIADSHVRPDHNWERGIKRLVVNVNLKDRRKVHAMSNFWMDLMFESIVRQLWNSSGRRDQGMCSIKDVVKFTIVRI